MPTILIGGYYGAGNIGDEAILASIVNELRAQKPNHVDLSLVILSWDPDKTSRELDVGAIHWKDIDALVDAVQKTDLIIVGGGGIFQDYWGFDPETYLRKASRDISAFGSLPLLAKLLDIPCMIFAVGVGPFKSDLARYHTRLAFERSQVATVRDEESLEILIQTGLDINDPSGPVIKVLPDPVFSLTTSYGDEEQVAAFLNKKNIDEALPLLGVSLRHWDIQKTPEEWLSSVAVGLRAFLEANTEVHCLFMPFQVLPATPFTDDVPTLKLLANKMDCPGRIHIIEEPMTPQFAQALIGHCQVIVGMRLHAVISAINVGTPVVALSYAPKVESVMKFSGLEEFCNSAVSLQPEAFTQQLQKAWDQRSDIGVKMGSIHRELSEKSKEHARLALDLLATTNPGELDFPKKFTLDQIRQLNKMDLAYEQLRETLQSKIWALQAVEADLINQRAALRNQNESLTLQLFAAKGEIEEVKNQNKALSELVIAIQSTRVWKMGQRYYHYRDNTIFKVPYYFAKAVRRDGLKTALQKARNRQLLPDNQELPQEKVDGQKILKSIISELNARSLQGVFVVTSTFEFDELYNQRVINLSKFLARKGWGVVYVGWVWHDASEAPPGEVLDNIFQIPSNLFLEAFESLRELTTKEKYFTVEFPYPEFLTVAINLKSAGFTIIYDIIDEWEEFNKVGQAVWFDKSTEEALVVNSNLLTAVSEPLIEKFSHLRRDIHLIPNGFDPAVLGDYQNIAQRHFKGEKINLGYFGHLTPAWFDWQFLKSLIDSAKSHHLDVSIHLIGYGQPDLESTLGRYQDSVTFHGKVHPEDLHQYAQDWDVAILPFKSSELSRAVDPIKIYEYLYFGFPVIVKGIPHLSNLPNVTVVSDEEEFIAALIALRNLDEREIVTNILDHTWEQRFTQLTEILKGSIWMSL